MTHQVKGYCWSATVHGIFILVFALVQFLAPGQNQLTVIDFDLSSHRDSAIVTGVRETQAARNVAPAQKINATKKINRKTAAVPPRLFMPLTTAMPSKTEEQVDDQLLAGNDEQKEEPLASDSSGNASDGAPGSVGDSTTAAVHASPGPSAKSPEESRAVYLREHFVYIRDRINKGISYPEMARRMGWCGQVRIVFIVGEDGGVHDIRVVAGSGYTMLDVNAIDTVKRVAPFPRPPIRAEIHMSIQYRLN